MKNLNVRIEDDLFNKIEILIKREGINKQQFIVNTIEEKLFENKNDIPLRKNEKELEKIERKLNLLLENQVEINNILTKLIGTDYAS